SRVILVAMLPPSGATWCDLLATMVETTLRTGTVNLARTLFSRPLATWTPARGVLRRRDDGDASLSQLTYAAPWVAAIPAGERRGVEQGRRTLMPTGPGTNPIGRTHTASGTRHHFRVAGYSQVAPPRESAVCSSTPPKT